MPLCLSQKKKCQGKCKSIGEIRRVQTGYLDSLFAEVWGEMKRNPHTEK